MSIRIGITGQRGFVGAHLVRHLSLHPEVYELVKFDRSYFDSDNDLDGFVRECDVIVHLAAMNRHDDQQVIYDTNIRLTTQLVSSLKRTSSEAHVVFSSSTQEEQVNLYGQSKKVCAQLISDWAASHNGKFTSLVIPNVFGPFGRPFYNSVVATFCHQLVRGEEPTVNGNGGINLIFIAELVDGILSQIQKAKALGGFIERVPVPYTYTIGASDLLQKLLLFKKDYLDRGIIPAFSDSFDLNLFNTFRSFIDHASFFPSKYQMHTDDRGSFVELIKLCSGGQVSFSTTVPGITRGNHFHTRKIERFSVIQGEAKIELRRIDTDEVLSFTLSGEQPAYVDMPVWYTHNISNIGKTELLTVFWINEFYDPKDSDTYFLEV
jgi:UDP-2-acetamido-2,6-beta-L-arabino-hexul-4-ose reductase